MKNFLCPNMAKDNLFLGICVIVGTVFTMAFTDAIVKYISADFPLWQIFVIRSLIAIPILIAIVLAGKVSDIRPVSLKWSFLRGMMLVFMYIAIYAAVPLLSLSVIAASLYTGPVFTALLSAFLIGENVGTRRWIAVGLGFLGVLVILRPDTDEFSWYMLIPILAGLLYALAAVITRTKCVNEKPQVLAIVLNFSILIVGLLASIVIYILNVNFISGEVYPFLLGNWITVNYSEWGIMTILAILIVIIGIGLAKAYQVAPPSIVATFDYTYLLFAAFWGFVFFAEKPDSGTVSGMLMIIIAGILVIGNIQQEKSATNIA